MGSASKELSQDEQVLLAAMQWHAVVARGEVDWDGFTSWLEQAPGHRQIYNDVALLDQRLATHRVALQQRYANPAPSRHRWVWSLAAAAAVLLGMTLWLGWQQMPFLGPATQNYQAEAGSRQIALKDGSNIVLAPGSRFAYGAATRTCWS